MKIEFRSQESVIFILGGGDFAMTLHLKIGVRGQKLGVGREGLHILTF
jgi:hypothetical protein